MKYAFIQNFVHEHKIQVLCQTLEISRSSYYEWLKSPESQREKEEKQLMPMIQTIFDKSRQTYGYRRIGQELETQNKACGKNRIISLMKRLRLKAVCRRKYRVTTDSNHSLPIYNNVLDRQFNPTKINQSLASDITYVSTEQGWLYVAVVMDFIPDRSLDGRWKNA